MKALLQRVKKSSVSVNDKKVSEIQEGLCLLLGIANNDCEEDINYLVKKIVNMRIFEDENQKLNKSILDIKGSILSISQFTLISNTKNGNRPSFIEAMKFENAKMLYDKFNESLSEYLCVKTGVFGADMQIDICADGPVTIMIDSKENKK